MDQLQNDYEGAATAMKRLAPAQSHAVRRAMLDISKWIDGVKLTTGSGDMANGLAYVSIPIKVNDMIVGFADLHIDIWGDPTIPNVSAEFKPWTDREEQLAG
jgi:hypothetical protein